MVSLHRFQPRVLSSVLGTAGLGRSSLLYSLCPMGSAFGLVDLLAFLTLVFV